MQTELELHGADAPATLGLHAERLDRQNLAIQTSLKMEREMKRRSLGKLGVVAFAFLFTACAEVAEAPTTPLKSGLRPRQPMSSYSSLNGSTISITDDADFVTYSYNADSMTITRSDGSVVHVNEEQASYIFNYFLDVYDADRTMADFAAACTPENPCAEPMSVDPGPLLTGTDGGETVVESPISILLDPASAEASRRHGQWGITVDLPKELTKTQKVKGFTTEAFDGYCSDLVIAVAGNRISMGGTRTGWVRELVTATAGEIGNVIGDFILPPGVWAGATLMTLGADVVASNVKTKVLGTLWNSHNCSERNVTVGRLYWEGGATSGTILRCHYEYGSISFDNVRFYPVTFEICQWDQQ